MSQPHAKTAAYLRRMLSLNPVDAAGEIVSLRSRALRLEDNRPAPEAAEDLDQLRADARKRLEAIRAGCWTAPQERLLAELDKLPTDKLPEVRVAADRLRAVANNRGLLPALTGDRSFDGHFFSCFKQVLAEPPRETAVLREQVLASFRRGGALRKKGRRMIELLRREAPGLYAVEADWLESLMRQQKANHEGAADQPEASSGSEGLGRYWWVVVVIIILIRALLRLGGGN